jgi:YVTN family beta-propeller protein
MNTLEIRLLGPVEIVRGDRPVAVPRGKQQELLVYLALRAGAPVARDRLIDELWPEYPPATAAKTLQVHLSNLRKALGENVLESRPGAYALAVSADHVDAHRFEQLVAAAHRSRAAGDPARAAETLREALALWRGEANAGVDGPTARREAARLEELRLEAIEDRIDAELELGREEGLAAELEALVHEHPLRERLRGHLMLAQYRAGRQADALETYRQGRALLIDELGIEPARQLQRLEQGILNHDPALAGPIRPGLSAKPRRRGAILVVAVVLAGVLAIAVMTAARPGEGSAGVARPNSLAVFDAASGRLVDDVLIGAPPFRLAAGGGAVWAISMTGHSVFRIDPERREITNTVALPGAPTDVAIGLGRVWVLHEGRLGRAALSELFIDSGDLVRTLELEFPFNVDFYEDAVAIGAGSVWVGTFIGGASPLVSGRVARVRRGSARVESEIHTSQVSAVTIAAGTAWIGSVGELQRFNVGTSTPAHVITLGGHGTEYPVPTEIDVAGHSVWSASRLTLTCRLPLQTPQCGRKSGTVTRVDARTNTVVTTIPIAGQPWGLEAVENAVWVTTRAGRLIKIDPATNAITDRITIDGRPEDVVSVGGELWVAIR